MPHPDGQFGHEDPVYPPEPWQCPRGYDVVYNGWSFVCDDAADFDREMPRREGYPDDWKPPSQVVLSRLLNGVFPLSGQLTASTPLSVATTVALPEIPGSSSVLRRPPTSST